MSLPVLIVLLLCAVRAPTTRAQITTAVCGKEFDWMTNSMGQNPCLVTAWLFVPCYGVGNDSSVDASGPGFSYQGPQDTDQYEASPCDCNTVLYSTLAACAFCQRGDIDTWPIYSTNCSGHVHIEEYPENIPGGTAIPAWAFLDVTTNSTFNVDAAKALADQDPPDITATSTSTSATSKSTTMTSKSSQDSQPTTAPTVSPSPSPTSTGIAAPQSNSSIGPIVGGVVGGVLGVLLTGVLLFYVYLRHRRIRAETLKRTMRQTGSGSSDSHSTVVIGYPLTPTSAKSRGGGMYYDANDPRTFPPPAGLGQAHSAAVTSPTSAGIPNRAGPPVAPFYKGYPQV